ncbi:MAG: radical SAM protein [Bifidobacteriaceae bacterium]|jgi:anaerobic ribonucleoside-triphosphate reductase activating protein|nr:radical SAM protein [Bifidobacteriaceae bacterium]
MEATTNDQRVLDPMLREISVIRSDPPGAADRTIAVTTGDDTTSGNDTNSAVSAGVLEINRILAPVTALGPGRRLGLWVQGCALRCPGCASRDTWTRGEGQLVEASELAHALAERAKTDGLTGMTITGGEPMDQAAALTLMVRELRRMLGQPATAQTNDDQPAADQPDGQTGADKFDVLVFTGYASAAAKRRAGALWELVDAVIAGPYRRDLPSDQPLLASSNQELIRLNPTWQPGPGGQMQMLVEGGDITMVGLPQPGDLDRLETKLRERGVILGGASWRN